MFRRTLLSLGALVALTVSLGACQASSEPSLEVTNAWVKSAPQEMTALFAEVTNTGSESVAIVGGRSDAASMVEVHEVVDGTMQPKSGGVVLEAGASAMLMPGGDHIMLMGLTSPLLAGDTVTVTLELSDGSEVTVEALVKDYAGANEDYDAHGGMDE